MDSSNVQMGIQAALTQAASYVAEAIKEVLRGGSYPHSDPTGRGLIPIEDSIVIGKANQNSISIYIGNKQAPYARAYEFGSGIHGDKGSTYPIRPKNKAALAFAWEGHSPPWSSKKFISTLPDGRFMFQYVDHPGVEAKPYAIPTVQNTRERVREILGKEFKASLLAGRNRVEIIR